MSDQIYLAPLEGMTDAVFRSCYYNSFKGVDRALTPFLPIPDKVVRVPPRVLKDVALPGDSSVPEIPQLLVSTPQAFLTAGYALEKAGYRDVNWNLGCPSKGVVNKGKGAGMMPKTREILTLLDTVLPRLNLRISLKIRLGMINPEDSFRLIRRLKGYPLEEVVCHPRLGAMMYKGAPDWERFGALADLTDLPFVYNGDILSYEDFRTLKRRFPRISRWMIGRGILRNPFLPEILKGERLPPGEGGLPLREERFFVFLKDLYEGYKEIIPAEKNRIGWMKGFLSFAIKGNEKEQRQRKQLYQIGTEKEFLEFLDKLFSVNRF